MVKLLNKCGKFKQKSAYRYTSGTVKKVKCAIPHKECKWGAHLPSLGREPIGR